MINSTLPPRSQNRKTTPNLSRARRAGILWIIAALGAAFLLLPASRTEACGPWFTDAIFVFSKHPDFPLETFASGKLGVVNPTWARSYLVVAYRTLSGNPLSNTEAKAIKSLWDDRLNNGGDGYDDTWLKKWNEARKQVPSVQKPAEISVYRSREKPHEYESFLNCQADAFVNATAALNERISRFGADSPQVRDWLTAQDTVFTNCGEGRHIPENVGADQDAAIRADRAYQIAAANFYATNFDEARQQFDAIAQDKQSPWRTVAPYLAARSMLRKGSFADKDEDARPALSDAESRLNSILKDRSLKASHHAAGRLLNLVRLRLHPEEKLHELGHSILKKDANDDFKQSVWDYTVLLDKYLEVEDEQAKKQLPATLSSDDLTDWIMTVEGDRPDSAPHALDRWTRTQSEVWLVAALTTARAQQANLDSLLQAAANINNGSKAFPSVAFHHARLLIETKRGAEARSLLDQVLANDRPALTPSATNSFLGLRMLLAQNLQEFLVTAQRSPAAFSEDSDGREIPTDETDAKQTANGNKVFFDVDAANVFNKVMPVSVMKDAALSKTLEPNLRRDVAQAAFLRAALLDDKASAGGAAPVLRELYPQLSEFLAAYASAATPDARKFAAAFMALKYPGLRPFVSAGIGRTTAVDDIDSYRDNYWCTEPPAPVGAPYEENPKPKPVIAPDFLKSAQALGAKQFADLQALGTAPNFLCQISIDWANKNPADPRAPEALHLAVRSTRYGCTNEQTGRWSKAAFDLLHRNYPNTTWARNTKYWFK